MVRESLLLEAEALGTELEYVGESDDESGDSSADEGEDEEAEREAAVKAEALLAEAAAVGDGEGTSAEDERQAAEEDAALAASAAIDGDASAGDSSSSSPDARRQSNRVLSPGNKQSPQPDPDVSPAKPDPPPADKRNAAGLPPPRELFNPYANAPTESDPHADPPPPRMRTGYPMLHPPPVHIQDEPPLPEPLRPNEHLMELVEACMQQDAERLSNPALSLSRVAYDAFDPIDLNNNLFVREDCLNTVLPAVDDPLGEAAPPMGAPVAAPAAAMHSNGGSSHENGSSGGLSVVAESPHSRPPSSLSNSSDHGKSRTPDGHSRREQADAQKAGFDASMLSSGGSSTPSKAQTREAKLRMISPINKDMLVFESRFESGNLRRAVQVSSYEYDLILRPDLNTRGHTQWFYFAFANAKRGVTYKFNILNCVKPDSLFNSGLQPLIYSMEEAKVRGTGWQAARPRHLLLSEPHSTPLVVLLHIDIQAARAAYK